MIDIRYHPLKSNLQVNLYSLESQFLAFYRKQTCLLYNSKNGEDIYSILRLKWIMEPRTWKKV
ncbi:hypothetical protein DLM78_10270 [Leptospira stimsonii]|uniref:Uncharacterized protein n=1 Tax=Leptospira stimsonii TaxID=2202203 RepID=A0A8B6RYH8_9LEPT|nr:hypothetical protein DLM78_10270 [Leptospira stimsonii]